jgi:hypothetical protein
MPSAAVAVRHVRPDRHQATERMQPTDQEFVTAKESRCDRAHCKFSSLQREVYRSSLPLIQAIQAVYLGQPRSGSGLSTFRGSCHLNFFSPTSLGPTSCGTTPGRSPAQSESDANLAATWFCLSGLVQCDTIGKCVAATANQRRLSLKAGQELDSAVTLLFKA